MNRKAFTLTELIATIVILGVLMTVAIPNVLSIIERNKALSMIEDAKKLITEVEYKIRSDTSIELPQNNAEATVVSLNYITNTDLDESPYGIKYKKDKSFVIIARKCDSVTNVCENTYYVTLNAMETNENDKLKSNSRGILLATTNDLNNAENSIIGKHAESSMAVPILNSTVSIKGTNYTVIDVK